MVVTNVGGLSEIVPNGKTGYVVDVDPTKIADAIIDFFETDREEEMVANCAIEKQKYSWSVLIKKIEEISLI